MGNFTRQEAVKLAEEMREAVKPVLAKHGLTLGGGHTTYGTDVRVRLDVVKVELENGVNVATPEAANWKQMARYYGLPEDGLGKTFRNGGHTFTVTGLNTRRGRYPVLATREDGKQFKFPTETVAALLKVA